MRPTENIEKLIKNIKIDTNAKMDKAVLDDVLKALEKSKKTKSAIPQPNIWRMIKQGLAMKLAAAVVIMTTLYFIIFYTSTNEQSGNIGLREVQSKPIAEMMSVLTINTIYRQGGFDAVQQHLEMMNEMKGFHQRHTITLRDILAELNGNGHDRRQL